MARCQVCGAASPDGFKVLSPGIWTCSARCMVTYNLRTGHAVEQTLRRLGVATVEEARELFTDPDRAEELSAVLDSI